MKVTSFACGPAANESERRAFEHLRARIESMLGDDTWVLLTNLTYSVTHQLQSDEIDIIAIGPPGVRVIEVKHWTPQWVDANPDLVVPEAERVTNKARKIGTTLRRSAPELGHVDGAILLTRESSRVKRLAGTIVRGVRLCTLNEWQEAVGLTIESEARLSPQRVAVLSRQLAPKVGVALDGSLRRFNGYVNLERRSPKAERFHRTYAGVHSTRQDRVILHLYDISASDEANAKVRARREYEALHRLQRYDWAPRVLDSYQPAPGYAGAMQFFTVVDPVAPSIGERAADASWATPARLAFARSAVRALGELHGASADDAPILHRNLTPRTILVQHDDTPIFLGFELSKIPAEVSVASVGPPSGVWDAAVAPEVRAQGLHAADARSDVYSLCASLRGLFEGRGDEASRQVLDVLALGAADESGARAALTDLESALCKLLGESPAPPVPPQARFWTEDQVVRFHDVDYRVVERLGTGGVGTTFKVVQLDRTTKEEVGTYVAKVCHDEEAGQRTVNAYSLARSHLQHQAVSGILEVASEWRENDFTALMTWIEGSPLREFMGVLPLLVDDLDVPSSEALILRWLRAMCEALDVLHRNGLVHGDVSPGNMIVSGNDLVLTDYDFVGKIGKPIPAPGTVLYCAPSGQAGRAAAPADDLFALAASFFHVLFEKDPFLYRDGPAKERGLHWEGIDPVEREAYSAVAWFLDRATDPDPARRFATAGEALAALTSTGAVETVSIRTPGDDRVTAATTTVTVSGIGSDAPAGRRAEPATPATPDATIQAPGARREEQVEWLKSLLQSHPGSRWGNSETRGLDSAFAERTYVETRLEVALYQDVLARRVRLVVLCGNAGDGKTALLQHLAERFGVARRASSERMLSGETDDGLRVRMNLDGSASWQGRSADKLLDEFLAPFQTGPPAEDIAHLLAINDGRLLEWIEHVEKRDDQTPLTLALAAWLRAANAGRSPEDDDHESAAAAHIRFISLNHRSLVGGVTADGTGIDTGFLERLLDGLYGGEEASDVWAPCATCSAQDRCDVFHANQRFGPDGPPGRMSAEARTRARARLFEALQAVHLRGDTHVTVRELRATLVYILFGMHFCEDYHRGDNAAQDGGLPVSSYWDRAFDPQSPGRQGEVLRELVRFDPALDAHPQIDRHLLRAPRAGGGPTAPRYPGITLTSARRRAYFEWTERHIESVSGDSHALDLARGRHLRRFQSLPIDESARDAACRALCNGIARLEMLPPQALDRPDVVPLRITPRTPTETAFWIEKRLADFRLEAALPPDAPGLDRLHRQASLVYRYRDGGEERLRLGAELFHLLLELADGYQLGDSSTDDTFAHLEIFVQRLEREDDRRLLAWNPMRDDTICEVTAEHGEHDGPQRIAIRPLT